MRVINTIVLLCFLGYTTGIGTTTTWAQQTTEKKTLAVLSLLAAGVAETEASALTERLNSELFNTESFIVIERSRVRDILANHGIEQAVCSDAKCIAQAGKLLGAQILVLGSVGKLGQTYTVEARLVDAETARVLASKSIGYRGEIDGLLGKIRELAQALTSPTPTVAPTTLPPATPKPSTPAPTTPPPSKTTPAGPSRYQLRITAPMDATVYIDGQTVGQGTVTRALPAGSHRVRVTRNKSVPWEQTVELTQNQTLTASLTPIPKAPGGSKKWVWGVVGGLIAVGGGAAVATMGGGGKGTIITPPPGLGRPPGPP